MMEAPNLARMVARSREVVDMVDRLLLRGSGGGREWLLRSSSVSDMLLFVFVEYKYATGCITVSSFGL